MSTAGPEFQLIDAFVSAFSVLPPPLGPGDDCAVLDAAGPTVVTTDAVVEGVHFTLDTFSLEDVGHKALAVNLSDVAAMGAKPSWFTVALGIPPWVQRRQVKQLAAGMSPLARLHRAQLIGGNITSAQQLSITITAAGALEGAPLLRSGGRAGDALYVSGFLGEAAAGLEVLSQRIAGHDWLASRQRRPSAHVAFGRWARPFASAAIDISDGLAQDAAHLCRASGVGAELLSEALPLSPELLHFCSSRAQALQFALRGGEDYVLLLAVRHPQDFERAAQRDGFFVQRIGTLCRGSGVKLDGKPLRGTLGYQH